VVVKMKIDYTILKFLKLLDIMYLFLHRKVFLVRTDLQGKI